MIYLSLGSNIGDRKSNIEKAIDSLSEAGIKVLQVSSFYETEPVGVIDQPIFLNVVLAIATALQPTDLLAICLKVEKMLGRVRKKRWGPRVIDIDILVYHQQEIKTEELCIPHPRLHERRFVLVPLCEIASQDKIINNQTAGELLAKLIDSSGVEKWRD
jgi:2-amino-4-hydroxy-6-hydroxymethyldihydropteridine diphosphokinase